MGVLLAQVECIQPVLVNKRKLNRDIQRPIAGGNTAKGEPSIPLEVDY